MQPKVNEIWEWDIDRTHVSIFKVKDITTTQHEQQILCEVVDGYEAGSLFKTNVNCFNNNNWRCIKK